ncbi:MAG TPA: polymer-forming cytoskeletal protein [Longimicrobiales bacterium]
MAIGTAKKSGGAGAPSGPAASSPNGSLIARGMVLKGDCMADGPLRIDGHVTGNVTAARLVVGPGGRVDGDVIGSDGNTSDRATLIEGHVGGAVRARHVEVAANGFVGSGLMAHEAVVHGHVKGAIVTEDRLVLEATATVEGDVTARRLGLKEGGQVFGTIRIGEPRGETGSTGDRAGERRPLGDRGSAGERTWAGPGPGASAV